jgi:hypothetical protein
LGEGFDVFVGGVILLEKLILVHHFFAEVIVAEVGPGSPEQGKIVGEIATTKKIEHGRNELTLG